VWDGRLDNREQLLGHLADRATGVTPDCSDGHLVGAGFARWRQDVVDHLVGDFAFALFDRSERVLLLARDPLGIRPLYYARRRQSVAFGSEIKALFASRFLDPTPNDALLAAYLLRRWPLEDGGDTFFAGVGSVRAGSCLRFQPDGLAERRKYWDFNVGETVRFGDAVEYSDAFVELFGSAVRRRLRGSNTAVVSVSGGLDSSSIYCIALDQSRSSRDAATVKGLSIVSTRPELDETRYLDDIERRHGVSIDRMPWSVAGLLGAEVDLTRTTEWPAVDWSWRTSQSFLQRAREIGGDAVLSGMWGDHVTRDTAYFADLFLSLRWVALVRHMREQPRWLTEVGTGELQRGWLMDIVRSALPDITRSRIRAFRRRLRQGSGERYPMPWYTDRLRQSLEPEHAPADVTGSAHAVSLYRAVRAKHQAWNAEANNKMNAVHGLDVSFPFIDRDVVSFLMSIPGDEIAAGGVPRAIVRSGLRSVLPSSVRERRWKAYLDEAIREISTAEASRVADWFREGSLATRMGYIRRSELERQLQVWCSAPSYDMERRLGELVGLEGWLRAFFGGGSYD
jgi:asparagine synthase (glutamine-hydrolysing)